MSVLKILTDPDPRLRKAAAPVTTFDEKLKSIISDMADTMYLAPGVGLAATQAGIDMQLLIYDPEPDPKVKNFKVLVNPEIISSNGEVLSENEGCLSVPDFRADVKRADTISVKGMDENGKSLEFEADDFVSVILQHEIDHLNGILFIDHISALKRHIYRRKLKKELKHK
ncbi:MAG: peptide deformylase [Deltaproteobacteria bacterium]|nr:peptide deformylase [Deltaproteobacteria bacterium]